MKKIILFLIVVFLAVWGYRQFVAAPDAPQNHITVSGAWALYPMVGKWASDFQKNDSMTVIDLSAGGAGKGMTDVLGGMVDLGMISRHIYPEEIQKGAFYIAVAEDAVVPTVSAANPYLPELTRTGITRDSMIDLFITGKINNWRQLTDSVNGADIHVYSRSDACGAKETWAAYLKQGPDDFSTAIGIFGDPAIAAEVAKNPSAVGYNNIGFFFDPVTRLPHPGLAALPLDLNGNGILEPEENFYATLDAFTEAVADGRYPRPPARELYLVTQGKPNAKLIPFLRWILTDGQKEAVAAGYIPLPSARAAEMLQKLGL